MRGRLVIVAIVASCAPAAPPGPDPCEGQPLSFIGGACRCDAQCPDVTEGRRFCDRRTGECVLETQECARQLECCACQVCVHGVYCLDAAPPCLRDGACDLPGQVCRTFGSGQVEEPGCLFEPCSPDGGCSEGLRCFDGVCVGVNPCFGGCEATEACVPATNQCFDVGDGSENNPDAGIVVNRWPATCRVTCPADTIRSITAPTTLFNRCNRALSACRCVPKVF